MNANELRASFTGFFERHGHEKVPSASLIPHDPSVLFNIAGMVPFKPYFVGDAVAPFSRATSIQKCIRTSDIDIIGTTQRHCTFFEMLGNFSFGDYFKQGAISYAYELVTEVFGIDPELLWVTVHESDEDAADLWLESTAIPASRIQRLGEDNFWQMGETGPCGPSSEIFFDKGAACGADGGPAFGGDDRFVEIWNLVFMEYLRHPGGALSELPTKNIDTGSGLERVLGVLQGVDSVFSTDLFAPMIDTAQSITGQRYGDDERTDVALRILADHGRSMTMLVADGVLPTNEGRGYVLRRLIRRSMLAARRCGATGPIVERLAHETAAVMGTAYPNLVSQLDVIAATLVREEEGFNRTLRAGLQLLEDELASTNGSGALSGAVAFRLHDTHGFPIELTTELAAEAGRTVDRDGFDVEMDNQRERARQAAKAPVHGDEDHYRALLAESGSTEFLGRDPSHYALTTTVVGILAGAQEGTAELFLAETPFYAEGGGQMGDTGRITTESGTAVVFDTVAVLPGLTAHKVRLDGEIFVGQEALAVIDGDRRDALRRNHTATHLLHAALRSVLGDHVRQQGSLVAPDRLRFDFAHHAPLSEEELHAVVTMANGEVLTDAQVDVVETTKAEAETMGAVAFFGDKYGDVVRVIKAGDHSLEFCGGTHVRALGQIGTISVLSEASIGSNTRRIEAVTGFNSLALAERHAAQLSELAGLLKTDPEHLSEAVTRMGERQRQLEKELASLRQASLEARAGELASAGNGQPVLAARVDDLSGEELRSLAQAIIRRGGPAKVALIGEAAPDKVAIAIVTGGEPHAGNVAKAVAQLVGGGGGGPAEMAVAGGRDASGIASAIDTAATMLEGS